MILINAEIKDGVVYIDGNKADDVKINAQGETDSIGQVLIGKDFAVYIVNTQPDLKETMEKLIGVCDEIINIANTSIALGGTGSAPMQPFKAMGQSVEAIKKEIEDKKLL